MQLIQQPQSTYHSYLHLALSILAFILVFLFPACGGSTSSSSPTAPINASTATSITPTATIPPFQPPRVTILDNFFNPKTLHIAVGQTVIWTNTGQALHTVTADNNSFDSGAMSTNAQFKHTFTHPGRYRYYCQFHGGPGGVGMAGVIIVTAPAS